MRRTPQARQAGFTLIEVLVALAIVAVAMSAAVRAVSLTTQGNALLRDKSIAMLAAENRMAEIQLEGVRAGRRATSTCSQGVTRLICEEIITATEMLMVFRIEIRVHAPSNQGPPLARLESLASLQPHRGRP